MQLASVYGKGSFETGSQASACLTDGTDVYGRQKNWRSLEDWNIGYTTLTARQIFMLPCIASCRAVWWVIQLWWFCAHALLCLCGESDETDPKVCLEQGYCTSADIRSFEDIFKVLSLRPTFQRTSTPQKHQDFLSRCEGYLAMRTHSAFLNIQYPSDLVISVLGIFSFEDDQNQVRHRTEYCFGVSLLSSVPSNGSLLPVTRSSPVVHLFSSFWGGVKDPVCSVNAKTWCTCASQHLNLKTAFVQMNLYTYEILRL